MAIVRPFRATRANSDKVSFVSSRSYESYTDDELEAILKSNPSSFLHIINAANKIKDDTPPEVRFELIRNKFLEFKEKGIFQKDENSSFYIYKKTTQDYTFCGILATTSSNDYEKNSIKKHEETIHSREVLFSKYLETVGFNAEPVLLTYPDNDCIASIFERYQSKNPAYKFVSNNMKSHSLWQVTGKDDISKIISEFKKMDAIYIADGHHRTASSYLVSQDLKSANKSHNGTEGYNFFMSYLIPESNLKISSFNRFIKNLNGLSKEEFLLKLNKWFRIKKLGKDLYSPSKKHHFSMYFDGVFYSLYLRKTTYIIENPLSDLDAQLLYETVLRPILGIKDLRNDDKIVYLPAKNAKNQLKTKVDSGEFKVSFGLFPATVSQIKTIANANMKMPPKSTYIEPKLRSGLTLYEFE